MLMAGKNSYFLLISLLAGGLYLSLTIWVRGGYSGSEIAEDVEFEDLELNDQNALAQKKDPSLLLDTPGCKIPKLDPYDSSLKKIIAPEKELVCPGKQVFLFGRPNGSIALDESILHTFHNMTAKNLKCEYRPILRMREAPGEYLEDFYAIGNSRKLHLGLPLGEDFVEVKCQLINGSLTQYIPLVPLKLNLEKMKSKLFKEPSDRLNVILIGVDSVSSLNFQRQFHRTRDFVDKHLSAFKLNGYTKVGDNTFPNIVPMLTGHFVDYYWNETLYHKKFFDDLNFVWKSYANNGYRTFFAEDSPRFGTFNYGKRGFREAPTDYYFRPMALAIDNSDLYKTSYIRCLNSQIDVELILNYLRDFVKTMDWRPFFAYAMISTVTHDHLNRAGHADKPILRVLTEFWENGVFNKSLVILFSDHGIRFGPIRETYVGKFEERMPFIYVNFPPWFLQKHPKLAKHLRENQDRLTTHFDIHATLVHLLKVMKFDDKNSIEDGSAHGISLMDKISVERTCEDANILPHWCPCQQFHNISTSDNVTLECANAIIEEINRKLQPYKNYCALLELGNITDAQMRQVSDVILRFVKNQNIVINRNVVLGKKVQSITDYLITLIAKPSHGVFESTVRHRVQENSFEVLDISRINAYGDQPNCIQSSDLRKFCYCKS